VGFAQDMLLHHEQALILARMAQAQGTEQVQAMAQAIINQQLKEMGYLQGWLMLWEAPATAEADDMPWMKQAYRQSQRREPIYEQYIESCRTGQGMPGLATSDELQALSQKQGAAFDRQFLALMARHHQGAVVMARFASEFAEQEVVRNVANTMATEQRQELAQLLIMLNASPKR
jgi:uncharacterized protein (DUF305 family)